MSIMDELKRLAHPYEDDEDEFEDEYEGDYEDDEEEEEPRPTWRAARAERAPASRSGSFSGGSMNATGGKNANVVPFNSRAQVQVVLVKPEKYGNASEVADHLLANRTVVLNLEHTEKNTARRLLDFLSGVAYANHGKIQRVAASTYIITPANVEFQGDLKDEMENNGMLG
ncbi:MAG: cell division protein SepF [Oscillospiraceae bacterium]|nr:cell division protein SepF [Oscillospiraceae bacterium]